MLLRMFRKRLRGYRAIGYSEAVAVEVPCADECGDGSAVTEENTASALP